MPEIHSYLEFLTAMDDKPLRLEKGQMLFEEGQPADGRMYIVRSGSVELRSGRRLLETVGPGGVLGEMALIDPAPRSASAIAGPGCMVSAVDEKVFYELVKSVPGLAIEVMRILSRRLRLVTAGRREAPRASGRPSKARPRRPRTAAAKKKPRR